MSVFLTPDGRAVLRGHLLPAGAPPRDAVVPAGAAPGHRRGLARAAGRGRRARRQRITRAHRAVRRSAPLGRAAGRTVADAAHRGPAARRSTPTLGRVRRRPEVPAADDARVRAAAGRARRARTPREHGRRSPSTGWPTAASTTRWPAASRGTRPTSDGTSRTSRRCSTTTRSSLPLYTHAWLLTGPRRYRSGRARDARVPAARVAASRRRLLLLAGRRLRGRRGQVLRPGPGTSSWRSSASRVAVGVRRDARGQLGGDTSARTCCGGRASRWTRSERRSRPGEPPSRSTRPRLLFEARERRVPPATDDKVLAAWNGLAIARLRRGRRAFGEPASVDGGRGVRHVRAGASPATPTAGCSGPGATGSPADRGFADDHALMASACLTLYETTGEPAWFDACDGALRRPAAVFHDERARRLLPDGVGRRDPGRPPEGAVRQRRPGGNSAAAEVFLRLAAFTADGDLEADADAALRAVGDAFDRAPTAFGHALCALDRLIGPGRQVAIVGDPTDADTIAMVAEANARRFRPNVVLAVARPGDAEPQRTIPLLRGRSSKAGVTTAYVCEGFSCRLPVTDPAALSSQLDEALQAEPWSAGPDA